MVSGIGERNDFHTMQWPPQAEVHPKANRLSRRETEIIALLAKGFNTLQISERLCISGHTVRTHRKNILQKTKCRNSSELIRKAFEQGYL